MGGLSRRFLPSVAMGRRRALAARGGALAPYLGKNWWPSENIDAGTSTWTDSGTEGADLTQAFANPLALGIPIDGHPAIYGNAANALENAVTEIASASPRETWVVWRPDNLSTQLAFDGVGGTNRNTLFVSSTGAITANAGTNLATPAGTAKEHRAMLLRVVANGDGTGAIYVVKDLSSATSSPVASGTIGSGTWTGITLGASNSGSSGWKGEIAEVLRYDAVLTTGQAEQTAAYLLAKFPSVTKVDLTPRYLLAIGDSLTQGTASASGRSYRPKLFRTFEENDISPTETLVFRGSTEDRCLDHNGVSGETISEIGARMAAAITANSPDVIVLIMGTNDCQEPSYDGATAASDAAAVFATAYATAPSVPIVLCLATPLTNTTHNANVDDLNSRLESTVVPAADSTIFVVDPRDYGFTDPAASTTDGVHWNDSGETSGAAAIAVGLRLAL